MTGVVTVAVAGGSGSGKSVVCEALAAMMGGATIMDLDSYYVDRSDVPAEARGGLNFDEPSAFDLPLIRSHLAELRQGRAIQKPRYSFVSHTRTGAERLNPSPIVLVEGLFVLWWKELHPLLDFRVFLGTSAEVRLTRRVQRDAEVRGRTKESILRQFEQTVQPMHERYVEPTRAVANVVVANDGDLAECVAAVRASLAGVYRETGAAAV